MMDVRICHSLTYAAAHDEMSGFGIGLEFISESRGAGFVQVVWHASLSPKIQWGAYN